MRKILLTACLALMSAQAWAWIPDMDHTGLGLGTYDSLTVLYYIRGPRAYLDTLSATAQFGTLVMPDTKILSAYAEAAAATDGTRYLSHTVTQSADPASSAEVSGAYFALNRMKGSNATYVNNAIEGVARQYGKDTPGSGTMRGGYFRTYLVDTAQIKSTFALDVSARTAAGAVPRTWTAFVGERIYMAPNFTTADSLNNFHGLWLYNEGALPVNNAIRINDAGAGKGWDTLFNASGANASVDFVGHSGSSIIDAATGLTVSNAGAAFTIAADDTLKSTLQKAGTIHSLAGAKVGIPATDTLSVRLLKTASGSVGSSLIMGDTLMYVQGSPLSADRILCSYSASGAGVGIVGWFSIGPPAASYSYGKGLFGGAYETSIDTGCAYIGASITANLYKNIKVHPVLGTRILPGANAGVGTNSYLELRACDAPRVIATDSTGGGARTTDSLYYDGGAWNLTGALKALTSLLVGSGNATITQVDTTANDSIAVTLSTGSRWAIKAVVTRP